MVLCWVVLTWVLYLLLKPTDARLALLMAFFSLTALAVETACAVLLIQATLPGAASHMAGVDPAVRHGLVGMAWRMHEYGFGIALLMSEPHFLITGTPTIVAEVGEEGKRLNLDAGDAYPARVTLHSQGGRQSALAEPVGLGSE